MERRRIKANPRPALSREGYLICARVTVRRELTWANPVNAIRRFVGNQTVPAALVGHNRREHGNG